MATQTEQQRLRLDLGLAADDITSLSNENVDAIFEEAGEDYTDTASIKAATRVIAIDRLLMQAASDVDYIQNNSSEKASQRYQHLSREREKWQKRLDEAIADARGSSARFGRTTRRPARIKEHPGW